MLFSVVQIKNFMRFPQKICMYLLSPLFQLLCKKVNVNQSHYRPGQAQRVIRKLRFPDYVTTVQDGGKVVSLTHRPPLPPGNTPGTHFC